MIQLSEVELPGRTLSQLKRWQSQIDSIPHYKERVAEGKKKFGNRNSRRNKTFQSVKRHLTEMCAGARRCGYCEDSLADEVEHIWPKDLYPEFVFVWENYLYACGPCNGPKNNRFAVFSQDTSELTEIGRKRGTPVVPPISGEPVFIDPRCEDPLHYMALDVRDTFFFVALADEGTSDYQRAQYTIDVLGLNKRDALPAARKEAYGSYRARLREYIREEQAGAPAERLKVLIHALQGMQHPTVWREMQRQSSVIDELRGLFAQAPEALGW